MLTADSYVRRDKRESWMTKDSQNALSALSVPAADGAIKMCHI